MSLKSTIRNMLLDVAGVERVYVGAAPEGAARPYVVVTITSTQKGQTNTGPAPAWRVAIVEVAAVADTSPAAEAMASAIETALDGYDDDTIAAIEQTDRHDAPSIDVPQTLFADVAVYEVTYRG